MKYWYVDIRVNENTVVAFDLDDTLYNELDFLKSAYVEISKNLEPRDWKPLFVYLFSLYRSGMDVFKIISASYNLSKEELIQQYREHVPTIHPFKGVKEVFKKIKEQNGKIGIITDGRKTTQMQKIKALGLLSMIDKIVVSEEIGPEKPNDKNFRIIEEMIGLGNYYYVADNVEKDFITPNKLGWKTIGLMDNGLNIHHNAYLFQNKLFNPHVLISSFDEVRVI